MQWYEILIIIAACLVVLGVIISAIVRKKQGKAGCDCGCGSCSGCAGCSACSTKKDAPSAPHAHTPKAP